MRKGLVLSRFVDLQRDFCAEEDDGALEARLRRLAECRAFRSLWLAEMGSCGDASLLPGGANNSFLQTLDQIIEMEAAETAAQQAAEQRLAEQVAQAAAEARAREAAAVQAAAAAGAPPTMLAPRRRPSSKREKAGDSAPGAAPAASAPVPIARATRRRAAPPIEYLCPILKEPMREPVVAADGQTYEESAISLWLRMHDTSPLTGAALPHKGLTPNLLLRSMIREWGEGRAASSE